MTRRPNGCRDETVVPLPCPPGKCSEYAPACGKVARVQVGKAGIRLGEQLKKLFP
jgi:hypothetical protein